MATDTPNFNWPIPEDTDLVKDGAKAIRDLGNAIDTSAQDFGGGLVHIETQDSSGAVSALSFNDCFSADFVNYKIIMGDVIGSTTQDQKIRFRVAGSDNSTSNYQQQILDSVITSTTSSRSTNQTSSFLGVSDNLGVSSFMIDVFNPFESKQINYISTNGRSTHTTSPQSRYTQGGLNLTTSFTGFTLFPSTGTSTYTKVSVYGYRL